MAERHIWIFATPAGVGGIHPGNSSGYSARFQIFGAQFHHWGVFVADEAGDPSQPKVEKQSFMSRISGHSSQTNERTRAVQGTFFELTRPRDRDIGIITRTRAVRELEEKDNAKWITFADTGCSTPRSDDEISRIGEHICRERLSSDYKLFGKNCQDWTNLLGNAISVEPWIQQRTLEDIASRLRTSKDNVNLSGHSSDAGSRVPFGTSRVEPGPSASSSPPPNQASRSGTWSMNRQDWQAQTLSRAQVPNYATAESLAVPPKNPTLEMADASGFKVVVYSYNGEHRQAVKNLADSLLIKPAFSFRSSYVPVAFSKRQFKDSCLVYLGGKNAELAVNVDFSGFKEGQRRPANLESVLWHIVDYYKQIRSQPDGYDISYGWITELRGRVGDIWYLLLRFREETAEVSKVGKTKADEHWRFAPDSSKPTSRVDVFDDWAAFRALDDDMKEIMARKGQQ